VKTLSAVFATSEKVERVQVAFENGIIKDVGELGIPESKLDWFYPDECLAFAGMGDIHIHAREDVSQRDIEKECFDSASKAALNGGVTFVADMPNNPVPPIDDESYQAKLNLTHKASIPILLYAGIGPGTKPLSLKLPYKAYMGPSVGPLFFRNDQELEETIQHYKKQWVSFHCEDPVELDLYKNESTHHQRRPVSCEILATHTALKLIEKYQLFGKLCHYSSGEGLNLIRDAKKRGVNVTCEVTPQHLYFGQEELHDKNYFQMNPPIRDCVDRDRLLEAAKLGEIDFLATDHAPHTIDQKNRGTSGLTGLDTYGAFVTWLLKEKGFTPQTLALMTSERPGQFTNQFLPSLGLWSPKIKEYGLGFGFLKAGYAAQFTILNFKPTVIEEKNLKTKVRHSPFIGHKFPGSVEQVFVKGKPTR
jgi:dihydroorotase